MTRKSIGGGLCMAVNTKWAVNFTVRETECSKHHEIMTVSFRPHYLPREFTQITAILVYVPGPDFTFAAERIADCYNRAVNQSSDQPVLLLGDFNRCDVTTLLLSRKPPTRNPHNSSQWINYKQIYFISTITCHSVRLSLSRMWEGEKEWL